MILRKLALISLTQATPVLPFAHVKPPFRSLPKTTLTTIPRYIFIGEQRRNIADGARL